MQAWNWGNQATHAASSYASPQAFPGQVAQVYPSGQVPQAYPAGQVPQAYPAGQVQQTYPAGQVQQTYTAGQMPQAFPAAPALVPGQQLMNNYQQFYAGAVPTTTSEVPAGYTQQQWEAAQQQHFIQWQQWNQQYQQWQQEYGNTYSMAVQGGQTAPTPSATAEPPPLPPPDKPPPPPEENRSEPLPNFQIPPPDSSANFKGQKRPTEDDQSKYQGPADKKQRGDNFQQFGRDDAASTWGSTTDANIPHDDEADRSEQERVFDSQFLSWEGEFLSWKEQNINHPDKNQYMEYEKKWTKWREELLQRREQMRKKRLASMAKGSPDTAASKGRSKADRAAFVDTKAARNLGNEFQDPSKQTGNYGKDVTAPGHQAEGFGFRAGQPNQQPHIGQGQGAFPTNGKPEIKSLLDLPLQFTGQYAKKGYATVEKDADKPADASSFVETQKPQASQDSKSYPKTWAPNFQGPLQPKINFNFNKSGNNQQFDNANGSSQPIFGPQPKPDGPLAGTKTSAPDSDLSKAGQNLPNANQDFTQDVQIDKNQSLPQKSDSNSTADKKGGDIIDITNDDEVAPNYDFLKKSSVIPGLDLTPEKSSDAHKKFPSNEKKVEPNINNQPQFGQDSHFDSRIHTSQGQGFEFAKNAGGQFGPNNGPPPIQGHLPPPGFAGNPNINQWPVQGDGQQGFGMNQGQGFQGNVPGFGPFGPIGQPGTGPHSGPPPYFGPGSQNQNAGNSNEGPGNHHPNFGLVNQGLFTGQQNNTPLGPGNQNPNFNSGNVPNFTSPGKGPNFPPGNQNPNMVQNYNNAGAGNKSQNMGPGNHNQSFALGNMGPNYTSGLGNQGPNMGGNQGPPNMGVNQGPPNMSSNQGPNMGGNQGPNMGGNQGPNMSGNQGPNMGGNQGPNMGSNQSFGPGNMGPNFSPNVKGPTNMIPPLLPPNFGSGGPVNMGISGLHSNFGGANAGQINSGPNFGPGNQKSHSGLGNQGSNFNPMDQMNRNNQGFGNQNFGPKDDLPEFQRDQPPPRGPQENQNFPASQFGSGPRHWGEGQGARNLGPQDKGPLPGLLGSGPNNWTENTDSPGPWNKGGGGRDPQHPGPANKGLRDNFPTLGDITKRPPLIDKFPGGPMNKFPPKDGFGDGNKSGPMESFPGGSKEGFPKGFSQGPRDDFPVQDKFGASRDGFLKDGLNFPPNRENFPKDGPNFPGPRESFPKDADFPDAHDRALATRDRAPVDDPGFLGPREGFPNEGPDFRGPRNRFGGDRPMDPLGPPRDPLGPPREPFPGDRFPHDAREDFARDRFLGRDRFGPIDGPRGGFPEREFDRDPFRDDFRSREAAFHGDRSRSMEFEERGNSFFPRDHDLTNRDYDARSGERGGWDPRGGGRPPHDLYRSRQFDEREGDGYGQWDRPVQHPPGWEKVIEPVTIVEYGHKPAPPTAIAISEESATSSLEITKTFDYAHGATPRSARDSALLEPWRRDEAGGGGNKKGGKRDGRWERDRPRDREGRDGDRGRREDDERASSYGTDDDRFRGRPDDRGARRGDRDNDRDRNGRSRDGKRDGDSRGSKGGPLPPAPPPPSFSSPSDATKGPTQPVQRPILVEDLLSPPGRDTRPQRIVVILRGPPGSGKSFVAKLIKDKEVEMGGPPPRILCLDDYFMVEVEKEETEAESGRKVKVKVMEYEFEAGMEKDYRCSLVKAFKKTVNENYFPFIIVDCVNQQVKNFEEMWSYAKQKGFQVYICEMDMDVSSCIKRNTHNRTEKEIAAIVKAWEETPKYYLRVDVRSLLQSVAITEVEMEDSTANEEEEKKEDENDKEKTAEEGADPDEDNSVCVSKWERMEPSGDKLDRLDGLRRRKAEDKPKTLEDWLQLSDDYDKREIKPGQKRVRWADLEEKREQEKMRAIGFVVGQTDWSRMTDPTRGESALTQTKYI